MFVNIIQSKELLELCNDPLAVLSWSEVSRWWGVEDTKAGCSTCIMHECAVKSVKMRTCEMSRRVKVSFGNAQFTEVACTHRHNLFK